MSSWDSSVAASADGGIGVPFSRLRLRPFALLRAIFFRAAVLRAAVTRVAVLRLAAFFPPAVLRVADLRPVVFRAALLRAAVLRLAALRALVFRPAVLRVADFRPVVLRAPVLRGRPGLRLRGISIPFTFSASMMDIYNLAIVGALAGSACNGGARPTEKIEHRRESVNAVHRVRFEPDLDMANALTGEARENRC